MWNNMNDSETFLPSGSWSSVSLTAILEPIWHLKMLICQMISKSNNKCRTCVKVNPVFFASCLFSSGVGYLKLNIFLIGLKCFSSSTCCACTFPSVSSWTFLWSSKRFLLRPKLSAEADTYAGADTCPPPLEQQIQLNIFQLTKLTFWHRSRLLAVSRGRGRVISNVWN